MRRASLRMMPLNCQQPGVGFGLGNFGVSRSS
jgi:hypothetical protein